MLYGIISDYCRMAAALLDLQYLPNILWFRNFLKYETVWIEREENFVKSTYRNRLEIAGAGGKQALSIPLLGGRDHHQLYKDTIISYQYDWQSNHWQSIKSAYGSAPYFDFYAEKFQKFYEIKAERLFDYNLEGLNAICSMLKLKKSFELTVTYEKTSLDKTDLRSTRNTLYPREPPRYYQVFEERNGFIPNLSIVDLIFHIGPAALDYLKSLE